MKQLYALFLLATPGLAQTQTLGPWVVSSPDSASLVSGGGVSWGWLNVVDVAIDENEAFSGLPMDDDGFANAPMGTTVEVVFASGVTNGAGDDLLMLEAQFDLGIYTITCDFDGFVTGTSVDTAGGTIVSTRDYYYSLSGGPFTANVAAVPVDLSSLGVPAGATVNAVRFTCTNSMCDPIGLGRIETPAGTPVCFGDGSGTACPCGNPGGSGAGCANGTGAGGSLSASGTASVTADTLSLTADGVINNNGLFFQGNNTIGGGAGSVFGDGIRCCGGGVVRIQVVNPPGSTSPATAQMTETATTNGPAGTITAGTKKCYQYWYRDPATSPCGAQFNLTNAVSVTWEP